MTEGNPYRLTRAEVRSIEQLSDFSLVDDPGYPSTAGELMQKLQLLDSFCVTAIEGLMRLLPQHTAFNEARNRPDEMPFRFMPDGPGVFPAWKRLYLAPHTRLDRETARAELTVRHQGLAASAHLHSRGRGHRAFSLLRWGRTDEEVVPLSHTRVDVASQFAAAYLESLNAAAELYQDDCRLRSMDESDKIVAVYKLTQDEQDVFREYGASGLLYHEVWICARSISVFAATAL